MHSPLKKQIMEWEPLLMANAEAVITECRSAVNALERLGKQVEQTKPPHKRLDEAIATLVQAFEKRVEELAAFYHNNDLDPKAAQFEMCRLMLKRSLMHHSITLSKGFSSTQAAIISTDSVRVDNDIQAAQPALKMVTLKIILTNEEYKEILRRRAALPANSN